MAWTTSTHRSDLPPDWDSRIRPFVLRRDNFTCRIMGPRCIKAATHVDAITPTYMGGSHTDVTNLRAACVPCHNQKSSAEGNAAKPRRLRRPEQHPGDVKRTRTRTKRSMQEEPLNTP